MTAELNSPLPAPKTQFFNANGIPLAGGSVFTYASDGTTPKTTYQDSTNSVPNSNPIVLDAGGFATIWGQGSFVFKVQDSLGNLVYTGPTDDPIFALGLSTFGLSLVQAANAAAALSLLGISSFISNLVPVGTVVPWAGFAGSSPGNIGPPYAANDFLAFWVLCRGQAISRTTYAALFAAIGTQWGAGDGSTTFNVPNLQGRFPIGADYIGSTVGTASIGTLAVEGIISGNQLAQADTIGITLTDAGHSHIEVTGVGTAGTMDVLTFGTVGTVAGNLNISTASSAAGLTAAASSSLTGNRQNIPPMAVMNYLIYAGV